MTTEVNFQSMGNPTTIKDSVKLIADVDPRLTRSYYFASHLLTAEDLNRDQLYLDGRLREVGKTLGYGVLRGLALNFNPLAGSISVTAGSGVTRAGRILALTRPLHIEIGDSTAISELNHGQYRRLDRALYAVVVRYAEVSTDAADRFPIDLNTARDCHCAVISEGVELALVRLPQALGQHSAVSIRINLLQQWLGDNTAGGLIAEDVIALGVLAVNNDKPLWLDAELLRQPLRAYNKAGDLQQDMARRYQHIFQDLLAERALISRNSDFAATDYFRLLPPVGPLPKDAINPVTGRQGFFPENFNIWIAPVRISDIELLRADSMSLPPIDLHSNEPVDIIVLSPLSNALYGQFTQRLEHSTNSTDTKLIPAQDLLRLRLYPQRPVHELDADKNTWQEIWKRTDSADLFYIRRPLRAAETRLSGIVLAQGVPVPMRAAVMPTPADAGLLQNEDSVFLNRINLKQLAALRPPSTVEGQRACAELTDSVSSDAVSTKFIVDTLLRVERGYDGIIWQTLLSIAKAGNLAKFSAQLQNPEFAGVATAEIVSRIGDDLGMQANLIGNWRKGVEV